MQRETVKPRTTTQPCAASPCTYPARLARLAPKPKSLRTSPNGSTESAGSPRPLGASSVDEERCERHASARREGLLTDDALMDSFVRSCAVSSKPSPDSPSSVVSPGPRARYTCAQYLRVVADLSQYRHDVRLGTLLVGNGRSVLQNNAGGLVDNYGAVVRFNDYQTEGRPPPPANPRRHPSSPDPGLHPIKPSTSYQPVHLLPCRLPTCTLCDSVVVPPPPPLPATPPSHTVWVVSGPSLRVSYSTATPTLAPRATPGFAKHVGTKTTLWVLSDWVRIELIHTHPG